MSKEQDKSESAQKSVKIEDLPENTDASAGEKVKGGRAPRLGTHDTGDESA